MISAHNNIYIYFGSGIYHKPHSIFKSKYQKFHYGNVGIFGGNETIIAGHFMRMHRYLRIRKFLQATISSIEFISIPTNNKFTEAVMYIHDNKSWERCYVLLKILFTCLIVLRLEENNRAGIEIFYYYSRMTQKYIEKTIYDIDY